MQFSHFHKSKKNIGFHFACPYTVSLSHFSTLKSPAHMTWTELENMRSDFLINQIDYVYYSQVTLKSILYHVF